MSPEADRAATRESGVAGEGRREGLATPREGQRAGPAGADPGQRDGLAGACELLGDRWSLPIVAALLEGPLRYTEIQERLPGLAPNILTTRLRRLEQERLLVATRYSARPPRFDYRLTADGAALGGAIELLSAWGAAHADPRAAPTHADCGSVLEMRWWCPACGLPVEQPAAEEEIFA